MLPHCKELVISRKSFRIIISTNCTKLHNLIQTVWIITNTKQGNWVNQLVSCLQPRHVNELQPVCKQVGGIINISITLPFSGGVGWTTTCIVVTPPGISHKGFLHSPTVVLFSNILPALINFKSSTVLGPFPLSTKRQTCYMSISSSWSFKDDSRI